MLKERARQETVYSGSGSDTETEPDGTGSTSGWSQPTVAPRASRAPRAPRAPRVQETDAGQLVDPLTFLPVCVVFLV